MKLARAPFLVLILAAERIVAGPQGLEASAPTTNSAALRAGDARLTRTDVSVGTKLQINGPLVQPFRAKRIRTLPRGLLHLINPFARAEPREEIERVGGISSRPWTSVVGWSPGASAFPDAKTHEPTLKLISVSRATQP
jgi:hypothetical protein